MKTPRSLRGRASTTVKAKARNAGWRRLKQEYDAVHHQGMDALKKGDYAKFGKAIDRERVLLKEHAAIVEEAIARTKPKARKGRKAKARTRRVR